MVTGLADKDSKIKGLDAGANDFITKPFDVSELLIKANSFKSRSWRPLANWLRELPMRFIPRFNM